MAIVCPANKGEILLLQYIVGLVAAGNPILHLFSNDVTPTYATVKGDLIECSASGYSPITLVSSLWTTTSVVGVTTAVYSEVTFSFATSTTAFGYFVTDLAGDVLWLERFGETSFDIPEGGGSISILNRLTLS